MEKVSLTKLATIPILDSTSKTRLRLQASCLRGSAAGTSWRQQAPAGDATCRQVRSFRSCRCWRRSQPPLPCPWGRNKRIIFNGGVEKL